MTAKLTETQTRAVAALYAQNGKWASSYDLQISRATLNALVSKGVAERRTPRIGAMFSPRTAIEYRLKPEIDA